VDVDAAFGQPLRSHRFDAEVDGGDAEPLLPGGGDELRFGDRDLVDELGPGHLRGGLNTGQQLRLGSLGGGAGEDAHAHGPRLAQVSGQRSGVDVADAHDSRFGQPVDEVALGAPVRRHPRGVADDVSGRPDPGRFVIGAVDAGVADVRGGLDDDLAVVGRIGQRLLVAGHGGDEHGFAGGLADAAVGGAVEGAAVFEDEDGGGGGKTHCASSIISRMRSTVGAVEAP
jgi:hypothetical protein